MSFFSDENLSESDSVVSYNENCNKLVYKNHPSLSNMKVGGMEICSNICSS